MDQIEAMRQRIAKVKSETASLKELWLTMLPAEWLPTDRQFMVWLNIYDFHTTAYGIETASQRLNKKECDAEQGNDEIQWDKNECVRFASGVMKQQQFRDNPGKDKMQDKLNAAMEGAPRANGFEVDEGI
jgi:hypothetical protein